MNKKKKTKSVFRATIWFCIFLLPFYLSTFLPSYAIEIPLNITDAHGGARIAFVDMEVVYNVYSEKSRLRLSNEHGRSKQNYEQQISSVAAALGQKKDELRSITSEIERLRGAIAVAGEGVAISTAPLQIIHEQKAAVFGQRRKDELSTITSEIEGLGDPATIVNEGVALSTAPLQTIDEKELRRKIVADSIVVLEKELTVLRENLAAALVEIEKKIATILLEDIYRVIERLSKEEGVTLVIDKGYILYGPHGLDFTHKVIERLQ